VLVTADGLGTQAIMKPAQIARPACGALRRPKAVRDFKPRLIAADQNGVTFRCKDYRIKRPGRYKTMTLDTNEFIGRFLMHVLSKGPAPHPALRFLANASLARQYRQGARVARRAAALQRAQDCEGRRHRSVLRTAAPLPHWSPVSNSP
jgi:Putative transposase